MLVFQGFGWTDRVLILSLIILSICVLTFKWLNSVDIHIKRGFNVDSYILRLCCVKHREVDVCQYMTVLFGYDTTYFKCSLLKDIFNIKFTLLIVTSTSFLLPDVYLKCPQLVH